MDCEQKCAILPQCVPLPISERLLLEVVSKTKDWAMINGVGLRTKEDIKTNSMSFAPFILTPTAFPRLEFNKAVELQSVLNELMHAVAHDEQFLITTLQATARVDDFIRSLVHIYRTVCAEGITQPISLGLLRSDLMLETRCPTACSSATPDEQPSACCCWKQVEINTIASGFGHLGPASRRLQSFVLTELGHRDKINDLPDNDALAGLCDGMVDAWKMLDRPTGVILFLVEDVTYNICDQRFHEYYIRETYPEIRVLRRTLTQVHALGKLGPEKELLIGDVPVNVVYFRAGYDPVHYHGTNEWDARLLIERSDAIKCPSIQYHLAGTKKVQQALAKPGVLKRFLVDERKIEGIADIFTGLYSLDKDEDGDKAIEMALKDPERFVLKPQREGGGNNVYGSDIVTTLQNMPVEQRSAWILMERIVPPLSRGYMVRPGGPSPPELVNLTSELGIFGVIIGCKDVINYNRQVGHMLRTKLSSSNEGGVAAGLGALDSPYLID